jgi:hypothetical protein
MQMTLLGITDAGFVVIRQRLVRFSISVRFWIKKWEYNGTVHQLFIDFQKACDSLRREASKIFSLSLEYPKN